MIKLLHMDDDPDILEIGRMSLELTGKFDVKQCLSGGETIAAAEEFAPDVVLLDVMVPGMSGVTVASEIRKIESLANVPVIFMTARVQSEEVASLMEEKNAIGVISKPFDPVGLGEEIAKLMGLAQAAA